MENQRTVENLIDGVLPEGTVTVDLIWTGTAMLGQPRSAAGDPIGTPLGIRYASTEITVIRADGSREELGCVACSGSGCPVHAGNPEGLTLFDQLARIGLPPSSP